MNLRINKIAYNLADFIPESEDIEVEITAKLAVSKESDYDRAFFIELSMIGKDEETQKESRNLTIVARYEYSLDKDEFPDLTAEEIDADEKMFNKCIEKLDLVVQDISKQDEYRTALNLEKVLSDL